MHETSTLAGDRMRREQTNDKLKITLQFHAGRGTAYELQRGDSKLTIHVSPGQRPKDAGEWRVEAFASHGPSDVPIVEWGTTRVEALEAVGRTWDLEGPSRELPSFDWKEVARLLAIVSAI